MVSDMLQVFVAINAHPKSGALLRAAANKAKELGCGWTVIYVETPDHEVGTRESRKRILQYLTSAQEAGADIRRVEGSDPVRGIVEEMEYAQANGIVVHTLVLGKTQKEGFIAELKMSTSEKVARYIRNSTTIMQLIPLSGKQYKPSWFDRLQLRDVHVRELLLSLVMVGIAFGLSELLRASVGTFEWQVNVHNVTSFFLIATITSAVRFGLVSGMLAAIVSFGCINYFYVQPVHNFNISRSSEGISLLIFLLSAAVISLIGAYSRANAASATRKERRSQALHTLYRSASEAGNQANALEVMYDELSELLEMEVAFFLPSVMNLESVELVYPKDMKLQEDDAAALAHSWKNVRTTGLGASSSHNTSWRFEPMVTPNGEIGVLGINVPANIRLDASFGRLVSAVADQAASILERIELTKMMSESRMNEEREKLRAMLLSSVSHDLKTPLASIIGSLSVYKRMQKSGRLKEDTATELTETALDEAQRLDGFISNILDMTRIESGDIRFNAEWVDAESPVRAVQKRLRQRVKNHSVIISPPDAALEVQMDAMMSEQVLQNIIDNAAKYSPKGSEIYISYALDGDGFSYVIRDNGAGIPDDKLEAIFDKYERLRQSDSQIAGTGLGLAISKAVMEKQGGRITVSNHPDGGAVFTIWFPHARENK